MSKEAMYVAASRGRTGLDIITDDVEALHKAVGRSVERAHGVDVAKEAYVRELGAQGKTVEPEMLEEDILKVPAPSVDVSASAAVEANEHAEVGAAKTSPAPPVPELADNEAPTHEPALVAAGGAAYVDRDAGHGGVDTTPMPTGVDPQSSFTPSPALPEVRNTTAPEADVPVVSSAEEIEPEHEASQLETIPTNGANRADTTVDAPWPAPSNTTVEEMAHDDLPSADDQILMAPATPPDHEASQLEAIQTNGANRADTVVDTSWPAPSDMTAGDTAHNDLPSADDQILMAPATPPSDQGPANATLSNVVLASETGTESARFDAPYGPPSAQRDERQDVSEARDAPQSDVVEVEDDMVLEVVDLPDREPEASDDAPSFTSLRSPSPEDGVGIPSDGAPPSFEESLEPSPMLEGDLGPSDAGGLLEYESKPDDIDLGSHLDDPDLEPSAPVLEINDDVLEL